MPRIGAIIRESRGLYAYGVILATDAEFMRVGWINWDNSPEAVETVANSRYVPLTDNAGDAGETDNAGKCGICGLDHADWADADITDWHAYIDTIRERFGDEG